MLNVKIQLLRLSAKMPSRMSTDAAGYDLYACLDLQFFQSALEIEPGERKLISTGIALEIPPGYEAQIRPRSGLAAKHGITVLNAPATIDADYRGEVGVILINHGKEAFTVKEGDRIAQLVFARVQDSNLELVEELSPTVRGAGGFGSSDR